MQEKKLTENLRICSKTYHVQCGVTCSNKVSGSCRNILMAEAVDLIYSKNETIEEQKAEIERLTSLYDGKSGFMSSNIGDLPLTVEGLRKAVDEISRLLVVQTELQELNAKYYNEAKDLRRENTELQKQADEYKEYADTTYKKAVEREENAYSLGFDRGKEFAVKDTAKEIIDALNGMKSTVREIYGVSEKVGVDMAIKRVELYIQQKDVGVKK